MIHRLYMATVAGCVTFTTFGADSDEVQISGGDQPTKKVSRAEGNVIWKQMLEAGGRVVLDPEQPVLEKNLSVNTLNAARASLAKLGLMKAG